MDETFWGKDAVGEEIDAGDRVVYFRDQSGFNTGEAPLGTVMKVTRVERIGYEADASVLVEYDGNLKWFCHRDLMKV